MPARYRSAGTRSARVAVRRRGKAHRSGGVPFTTFGTRYQNRAPRVPRALISGLPSYQDARLVYADTITFTAGGGNTQTAFWGANCLYDPYLGVGGHQPHLYNEYMKLYSKYLVRRSTIRCRPLMSGTANDATYGTWYAVLLNPHDSGQPTVFSTFIEYAREDKRVSDAKFLSTAAQRVDESLKGSVYAKYDFLRENAKISYSEAGSTHKGTEGTNPTDLWTFALQVFGHDGAAHETAKFLIEITYDVRFHDRAMVAGS